MSQALYRRYRSTSFDSVVGQEHVTQLLDKALQQGAISHAYLFTGPKGVGKTSVARILAHAVNELPYSHTPHLDIIEIDAASNRRIDDVRDLREKVHIAPSLAPYKVYIIDEVHMLTSESFNALLKTLEEPPSHVIFILATTEIHKVPATIISRTQRFHFKPGSVKAIVTHLKAIAKKESIQIEDGALELIADHSDGSFRDSLSLLDQVSGGNKTKITRQQIEDLLGVAPKDAVETIVKSIWSGAPDTAVSTVRGLLDQGISPATIATQLSKDLLKAATDHPSLYQLVTPLLDLQRSHAAELRLIAIIGSAATSNVNPEPSPAKQHSVALRIPTAKPVAEQTVAPKQSTKMEVSPTKKVPENSIKETLRGKAEAKATTTASVSKTFTWEEVLDIAQKRAPALYGVLKRAEAVCSGETVTLTFQYSLHRKKLGDPKYSSQLSDIFVNNFGCNPEIIISDETEQLLSEEASTVADIMGGGKPINA